MNILNIIQWFSVALYLPAIFLTWRAKKNLDMMARMYEQAFDDLKKRIKKNE
jgi:uncharacterized membrane protein